MDRRIDAFAHILPKEVYDRLENVHPTPALRNFETADHMWDIENRLQDMDKYGIQKQVLTLAAPHTWRGIAPQAALPLTRLANDEIRRIADSHPERFVPVATLPFLTGDFLDEYERCIAELDMAGVQIFSNVQGKPLDAPAFRPFFDRANDAGHAIWIHPQLHEWYEWMDQYVDDKMLGWPFDTTLAISRLIFGDVLQAFPDLTLVTHHLGGTLPYLAERMRSFIHLCQEHSEMGREIPRDLSRPLDDDFQRIFADTAVSPTGSKSTIDCGLKFFGPDRVVFGTDYPFGPDQGRYWLENAVETIDSAIEDPKVRSQVYRDNIRRLISR